jgi:hypothetical protein
MTTGVEAKKDDVRIIKLWLAVGYLFISIKAATVHNILCKILYVAGSNSVLNTVMYQ